MTDDADLRRRIEALEREDEIADRLEGARARDVAEALEGIRQSIADVRVALNGHIETCDRRLAALVDDDGVRAVARPGRFRVSMGTWTTFLGLVVVPIIVAILTR